VNFWSLALSLPLFFGAVEIQIQTTRVLKYASEIRWEVMASMDPCPILNGPEKCRIRVYAKRAGQWDLCDERHAPSGADRAIHRYFKITGSCAMTVWNQSVNIPVPTQVLFR
jgi:hypothetical protein